MKRRAIVIVLDSCGIGEAPDAAAFGDCGSNTLGNMAAALGGLQLPNLAKLGLGNIAPVQGVGPVAQPLAAFGKMRPTSPMKDTTGGHWEIAGVPLAQPLPTFPQGFPQELMAAFSAAIGRGWLGNEVASGTEIIQRLGEEHVKSGKPIVYTSADSVFQIAAHEAVIPLPELYDICRQARALLTGPYAVGRVIARPFVGEKPGEYVRTANRHDFSLAPAPGSMLELLQAAGQTTAAVGKIGDIFAGVGISESHPTRGNTDGMRETLALLPQVADGLIFVNLVDFDSLYGHRNNAEGYAAALAEFDAWLPQLLAAMRDEDMLIITADHGNDPTTPSTDHSREYVPLLVYGRQLRPAELGVRASFSDVGATVTDYLGAEKPAHGESFLSALC